MSENHDGAIVRFFPPGIPLLTIVIGVVLNHLWPLVENFPIDAPMRNYIGGLIIILSVLVLGAWPVLLFKKGGQSPNPWKPTPFIEIGGPYKVTRNPMYLQMILVCIGFAIALGNGWILLLTPLAVWALQTLAIVPEEAYLEEKFGQPYLDYKQKVRRWI